MDMPISIELVDKHANEQDIEAIYDYFTHIDNQFSTFKSMSEISRINAGELQPDAYSPQMKNILLLCEQTKQETNGYFDISHNGTLDPSGLVKGWAIQNAAAMLRTKGYKNFYVDAGGDIQVSGYNKEHKPWSIGIRNPFNRNEIVKVVHLTNHGIATSGTAIRGNHIYNPHAPRQTHHDITSTTVIAPNVYDADRMATAAFIMGTQGIQFIEHLPQFECYMIDQHGNATYTSGFSTY